MSEDDSESHDRAEMGERRIQCPACHTDLLAVRGPFDESGAARAVLEKVFQEKDRERFPLEEVGLKCPHCSESVAPKDSENNEQSEFITAHCEPCKADWIVTTEKISGKAAGVGGSTERTRLTCPHCAESYIIK